MQAHSQTGPEIPCDLMSNEYGQEVWSTGQARGLRDDTNSACPAIQASLDRLSSAEADNFKIQGTAEY